VKLLKGKRLKPVILVGNQPSFFAWCTFLLIGQCQFWLPEKRPRGM
jgi:hypothetical protein